MIDQKEREGEKREKEQKRYMAIIWLTLLEVGNQLVDLRKRERKRKGDERNSKKEKRLSNG